MFDSPVWLLAISSSNVCQCALHNMFGKFSSTARFSFSMAMEHSGLGNRQSDVMHLLCTLPKSFLRSNIKFSCVLKCTALNKGNSTVVRALQLGAATDVCPDGKWVTFLCFYLARVRVCHPCLEHLLFLDEQKAVFTTDRNFLCTDFFASWSSDCSNFFVSILLT